MKKILTSSRLRYHLQPRMILLKDWKPTTSAVLRAFLFKKFFPIELAAAILIAIFSVSILSPKVFALSLPSSRIQTSLPSIITTDTDPGDTLNAYKTDDLIFAGDFEYTRALSTDIERQFYLKLVRGNQRIVEAVYTYAKDLNKDLVFALLLQESSGDPTAYNENIDPTTGEVLSVDRGLFQLNSRSYPTLSEDEFFQIETNVKYGIAHLRGELQYWQGNTKKALWTYNAGQNGILDQVPKRTIAYAQSIIADTKALKAEREKYIKQSLIKYQAASLAVVNNAVAAKE